MDMWYAYDKSDIGKMTENTMLEWSLSNGLGGYASGSVTGINFRKHHGLLIASLRPPASRYLLLAKIEETLIIEGKSYATASQKFESGTINNISYLESFKYEKSISYVFRIGETLVKKEIAPFYGHNAVAVHYQIIAGSKPVTLIIKPLFNFRDHSAISHWKASDFQTKITDRTVEIVRKGQLAQKIILKSSNGRVTDSVQKTTGKFHYDSDFSTGDSFSESHYTPCEISIDIEQGATLETGIVASLDEFVTLDANEIIADYKKHVDSLLDAAGYADDFARRLVVSADQFIADRVSTNAKTILAGLPWFTDWGRDTMIAFEGIMLATKRFVEAKSVLLSFARYLNKGLIPNMFPDEGAKPLYNTVDASLWYIEAIYQYYRYTSDWKIIESDLLEVVKQIIDHYLLGTDFNIRMDNDYLVAAGSGLDQVTWMDVRINGEVITPRHGKPVEINALWYNALMIMDFFLIQTDCYDQKYLKLAKRVRRSFNKRFWNKNLGCLYDVVDMDDPSIRPNQLFAVSLPFPLLKTSRARKVIDIAKQELSDIYGIRSLAKSDRRFHETYSGDIVSRDHSYHMGTAWGFLYGTYLEGYLKAHDFSEAAYKYVNTVLHRLEKQLDTGCLNGCAEVFDGHDGQISKGCYNQAWSVGEILRVYTKYGFDKRGEPK